LPSKFLDKEGEGEKGRRTSCGERRETKEGEKEKKNSFGFWGGGKNAPIKKNKTLARQRGGKRPEPTKKKRKKKKKAAKSQKRGSAGGVRGKGKRKMRFHLKYWKGERHNFERRGGGKKREGAVIHPQLSNRPRRKKKKKKGKGKG